MNQKCLTNCDPIDAALEGGIQVGQVTEIFGESGVGKTQLCLQLLLTSMFDPAYKGLYGQSIYLQAGSIFPAERLAQIGSTYFNNHLIDEDPLRLVKVKKIDDVQSIFLVLNQVERIVVESHVGCRHIRVVVLDSIAVLFRHDHDNTMASFAIRKRLLQRVANKMKDIASNYNLAFVVVNEVCDVTHPSSEICDLTNRTLTSGREVKAALGPTWESLMPNKIFMSKQYRSSSSWNHELFILKSQNRNIQGRRCTFRITADGLVS